MNNLYLNNIINKNDTTKIKKITHNENIYYELFVSNIDTKDTIYFETQPDKCNKCKTFFNVYKYIYIYYLDILKNNLNESIYDKLIHKLKNYHYLKCENNLIGTHTYWYIHLCHKCYNYKSIYKNN